MICVQADANGTVYVVDPQPTDTAGCGLVLVSGLEASQSPLSLTVEQATQIAGAILMVWGVAYVFRVLARFLSHSE